MRTWSRKRKLIFVLALSSIFFVILASAHNATPQVVASPPKAPSNQEQFGKVIALISSGLEEKNIPSVSIAVAHKGQVIWEQSFGWSDREKQIKATADTIYSLASVTKPMIATGLMVLVQQGKVDLDAPIERYIDPGQLTVYEGQAKGVTLRRLLHHTAGLPQHFNYFYIDEPNQPPPLSQTIRRFGIIVQPPGETFCYANLGYALIGDIIARVSGRPLDEFMREEVFQPLGMTKTLFDPDPADLLEDIAITYGNKGDSIPLKRSDTPGASHAYASTRDLIRFGMFHLKDHLDDQKVILSDSIIDQMQSEKDGTVHPGAGTESYGLGWFFHETTQGVPMVWHEGGWTGASAMLKFMPSEDIAVAVLMNTFDPGLIKQIADEAIYALALPQKAKVLAKGAAAPQFKLPTGKYSGEIRIYNKSVSLMLDQTNDGELHAFLGNPTSQPQSVFVLPAFVPRAPDQFLGSFSGPIGDPSAARLPHQIFLDLRFSNNELKGTASAMTLGGLPFGPPEDQRMHFHIPYRVSLKRMN